MTAFPKISVDIYPFESTSFSIGPQNVLACTITQMLRGSRFAITLAPGGPQGVIGFPSWSNVITPMSTVVIALQRENASNVVLIGVIEEITETQTWNAGSVVRSIQVNGSDISYYFDHFVYTLFPAIQGNTLYSSGPLELGTQASYGLAIDRPPVIASAYLQDMCIGPSGVMSNTYIEYGNSDIYLRNALYSQFEDLPITSLYLGDNFYSENISWAAKFANIMAFPQYEIIYGSAPTGQWSSGGVGAKSNLPTVAAFKSLGLPQAVPAYPQFIARQLRLPDLTTVTSASYQLAGSDSRLWNTLPLYSPAHGGFINSAITFNMKDSKNFYLPNPIWMNANVGNPSNVLPYVNNFYSYADIESIHRYGYRPWLWNTEWLAVLNNNASGQSANDMTAAAIALTKRLASYSEPAPIMGRGSVTMELRPDIFIGDSTYQPYRDDVDWQFYVQQVTHQWRFGGPTTTTLQLDRGLPSAIYNSPTLLFSALAGQMLRVNGAYTTGAASGLAGFDNTLKSQFELLAGMGEAYITPQYQ